MKSKTLFIFISLIYLLLCPSCNCKKENVTPPCYNCPMDFRVTDYEPAWSQDNKYIAYVHGDSLIEKTGIYIVTPDGKKNYLWHPSTNAHAPTWSPDGQWIAFSDGGQIWKKKFNGDSLIQLTFEGKNFFPAWSPDGSIIAYQRSYSYPEDSSVLGIWTIKLNSLSIKKVYSGNSSEPVWQSNDNFYFLRGVATGSGEIIGDSIFNYSFVDKNISPPSFLQGENVYLKYSPIIHKMAFSQKTINKFQIWIINSDGSGLKQLTNTQGYSCDWSPDGKKIIYTDSRSINGRLWLINTDGSDNHQLTF